MRRGLQDLRLFGTLVVLLLCVVSCRRREGSSVPDGVLYLGKITEPALRECSGVAMSSRYPNVFWTHNDSNNPEVLYAITRNGALIGKWRVPGVRMADWEDITFDEAGDLLLADTGDNRLWRRHVGVHRIKEPDPAKGDGTVAIEQTWLLSYPKGPRNAESIFVLGRYAYLITKRVGAFAEVYRFPLSTNTNEVVLELIAELNVGSRVTSAALSPDKKTLALLSGAGAFAYRINGNISELNGLKPYHLTRFSNRKMEGCTFTPEGLLTVSELRHMYLFTNDVFRPNRMAESFSIK
jgi:hypothetical protein